uniref:CBM20 domain-containing protein n=1 Tax=Biomphalaria glabrata TaxID=6526 RepID=A0A2C9L1E1_BIOGL
MKVKSTEIVLQFKVWCPSFNRIRHRLFLLGSLPELGAWNIYDALEAHPTADNHTWQVDVIVPHESTFEWVWLKTGLNRTGVEWERSTKRNRTVGYFSGVLHSVWANSEEVYLQSATFAEVTTYLSIDDGYTLVLTGSTPTTGLWDLAKAVPAIEFPKKSGFWKALVSFDALTSLDFQWAVVKEKDFTSVRQQEKVKHSITGRRCWMRIVAPWMLQVTGIVDISIINDTLDTVHGRTSVIVRERRKRIEEIISWTNDSNHSYMEAKNARRNFHVTTSSSESVERTKVSDIKRESSLNIIKQPAVRSNENLDELIQKNEERIVRETKTERFTKLLSDAYTELTNTLKGQGQTEMPPDPFTMDVSNQVPLLDGGLCLLMYSKTSLEETPSDTELPPTHNLSVNEDIGTSLSAGLLVLPAPREMYSSTENKLVDDILSNVDLFKKTFLSSTQVLKTTPSEEPLVETLIANVSTYPPPTWSMLQEENIEVTKNPSINARMRTKTAVKVVPMIKALQSRTDPPKPYSEKNLMEPSSSRGPFQLAGVSDVKGPLVIGADDTSKSPTEIDDERSNRQMWTNMRKHTSDLLRLDDVSSSQVDEESMV